MGNSIRRYYSPNAIVALLSAEDAEGWSIRVARHLNAPWQELGGPLEARQRSWYLDRQLEQLFIVERRQSDRIRGDLHWAEFRHIPGSRAEDSLHQLLEAIGTAAQRREVAEVIAAHDGHSFQWSWHLDPELRQRLRHQVQELYVRQLRVRVAKGARLLRSRPPDPSVTLANVWAVRELLQEQARRGRALIERRRSDLHALAARRVRARRALHLEVATEQARLERLYQRLQQIRQFQDQLDEQRIIRRVWEAQPEHIEVLAWGELSAERLRLLEFGALPRVEADPPPYLQSTIGRPFPHQHPLGRRAWLKAAWTIEHLRADRGVSDPDVALGLEPADAGARHLYDLAHQTLTVLRRDLERLHAAAGPSRVPPWSWRTNP